MRPLSTTYLSPLSRDQIADAEATRPRERHTSRLCHHVPHINLHNHFAIWRKLARGKDATLSARM